MRSKLIATALGIALAASGCGSDSTSPGKVTFSGHYTGSVGSQFVDLTLLESNGNVSGSGTLSNTPTGTRAQSVTGVFTNPGFTLTLSSGSAQPIAYAGQITGPTPFTQLVGNFNGSGFTGDAVTLTKQ